MRKLLLIESDAEAEQSFRRIFDSPGLQLTVANGTEEALRSVSNLKPDVVLVDMGRDDARTLEVLSQLRQADGRTPVVILSSPESVPAAIEAIRRGAYDYLLKPFEIPRLQQIILAALEASIAMKEPVNFEPSGEGGEPQHICLGHSSAMRKVFDTVDSLAQDDIPVLITGETGTGKQLLARAIYQRSRRNSRLFLSVKCSAIPATLVESELFGNERTFSAPFATDRIGRFEQCSQGTVLLNEIGDLPTALQSRLLRLIQAGTFERANGMTSIQSDVRLLATSSRCLEQAVAAGSFHSGLLSALVRAQIRVPPLRERKEDIRSLVKHHAQVMAAELRQKPKSFSTKALAILEKHGWPGNVRELREAIQSALAVAKGDPIVPGDLPRPLQCATSVTPGSADASQLHVSRKAPKPNSDEFVSLARKLFVCAKNDSALKIIHAVERELVINALVETKGNKVHAARLLGITRATLRKRVSQFHIEQELLFQ